jgi:hypothetical protein
MQVTPKDMNDLREALQGGSTQRAYQALLSYMNELRRHFQVGYPEYSVSALYQGYLDMTYFALVPPPFKRRGLKVPIVFNYKEFKFEVWLSGRNQQIHRSMWGLFKDSRWPDYRVVGPGPDVDSIVEWDLVERPDFSDLGSLTATIDKKVTTFIGKMEGFISRQSSK